MFYLIGHLLYCEVFIWGKNWIFYFNLNYESIKLFKIPIYIILPSLHAIIMFSMVKFGCDFNNFAYYTLALILSTNCAVSIGKRTKQI